MVGARVVLIAEVGNPHDAHAVEVRLAPTNEKLGYLSRQTAPRYRRLVTEGLVEEARIVLLEHVHEHPSSRYVRIELLVTYADPTENVGARGRGPVNAGNELPSGPGVYVLVNDVEGRSYIGSSHDIRRRVAQHFADLAIGRHANALLQADYSAQRGERFSARLVGSLPDASLCEASEAKAISAALRRKQKLYNLTADGRGISRRSGLEPIDVDQMQAVSERPKPQHFGKIEPRPSRVMRAVSAQSDLREPDRPREAQPSGTAVPIWLWIVLAAAALLAALAAR